LPSQDPRFISPSRSLRSVPSISRAAVAKGEPSAGQRHSHNAKTTMCQRANQRREHKYDDNALYPKSGR